METPVKESKVNKVKKYITHILGESVLVIVGILIALQIDGYVQEKSEIKNLKSSLNYVLEDLDNNKAILLKLKDQKTISISSCTTLLDSYKQQKNMLPEEMIKTLRSILITNRFENNFGGFDRVSSSALYESNDFLPVRDKIREYSNVLADLRFTEEFMNLYIAELSLEMSRNGALFKVFDYVRITRGIAKYKAEVPTISVQEILEDNKPLQAVLHKYEFDAPSLIKNYEQLLAEGKILRDVITAYLEK
ncbi:MAG: hypothetical protein JXR05_04750 [Flavobacteriaceae bacterium]